MNMFRKNKGNALFVFLIAIIILAVLGFGWYKNGYNTAITLDERTKASWAQVENQLQRRNDLIPNLVNTVKGYAAQEKEILTEVTRLRSQWGQAATINEKVNTANELSGALSRLLLVAENYPQLKSNENFLALQSQLEGTENRIAVERMRYNQTVENLSRFQRSFFGRFFTQKAGVTQPPQYFKASETSTQVPQVLF